MGKLFLSNHGKLLLLLHYCMVPKCYQTRQRCSAKVWGNSTEDYKMHCIINQRYPPFTVTVKSNPSSETPSTLAASCFVSYLLANNTVLLGQKPLDSKEHRTAACFIHNALHITIYLLNDTSESVVPEYSEWYSGTTLLLMSYSQDHTRNCVFFLRKNAQLRVWSWFHNNSWINKLILN